MRGFSVSFRGALLTGVAVLALCATPAAAEDPVTGPKMWRPDSFWLEIEGAYQWVSGSRQPWASDNESRVFGQPQTLLSDRPDTALQGKIEVGFKINHRLDVAFAYTGLREKTETNSRGNALFMYNVIGPLKSFYSGARVATRSTMHVVDFEVGYEVGLGSRGLARIHGGIRFAHLSNDTNTALFYPGPTSPYASESLDNQTWGIGPRLGVAGKFRLASTRRGIFSLVGGVSGAVLFGRTSRSIVLQSPFLPAAIKNFDDDSTNTIFNVEGRVGVSYAFPLGAWGAAITIGYRGSAWWNVINTKTAPDLNPGTAFPTQFQNAGDKGGNRFYHGPFISFRINF